MDKSVDQVHVCVDRLGVLGPPWINVGADRGHSGALTGAWPLATPVHQSSPAGAQNRGGARGTRLGSHRSLGSAEEAGRRWCRTGRAAALGERATQAGREGNRSREWCGEARGGCSPLIGAGGAPGRGGRGG
jgi:hypothetical protein